MKQFDFYEFAGVLAPGAVLLFGASVICPALPVWNDAMHRSLGDLGVFVVLAYVAGHLVQAVGNVIEWLWWQAWGGMPTDWIRTDRGHLIARRQSAALRRVLEERTGLGAPLKLESLTAGDWRGVTRQMYAAVAKAGRAGRVDTFNGNYGMFRGIASGLLVLAVLVVTCRGLGAWRLPAGLLAGMILAIFRMHRFGKHYARELVVQFLELSSDSGGLAG